MPASPSFIAVLATATATVSEMLRKSSTCGRSEDPGKCTSARFATARAAAG